MANLRVTFEDMRGAAVRLRGGQDELTATLAGLQGLIDSLVAEGFVTDAASVAFQETYSQFTHSATSTVAALEQLGAFLASAADAMQQTDEALAGQIRSR